MTYAIVVIGVAAVAWAIYTYNLLVRLQKRSEQAFSDIDAQLKRRHDLVPALVETVKGYAGHERQTLEEVIERRSAATAMEGAGVDTDSRATAENLLARSMRGLFVLAEDYPDLKASERFGSLQTDLSTIENDLQHARRYYNAVVRDLNTTIARFPNLLIAGPLGFEPRTFFQLDSPLERAPASVGFEEGS